MINKTFFSYDLVKLYFKAVASNLKLLVFKKTSKEMLCLSKLCSTKAQLPNTTFD